MVGAGFSSSSTQPSVGTGKQIANYLYEEYDPKFRDYNFSKLSDVYAENDIKLIEGFIAGLLKKDAMSLKGICDRLFENKGEPSYKRIVKKYFEDREDLVLDTHVSMVNLLMKLKAIKKISYPQIVSFNIDQLIEKEYSIKNPGQNLSRFVGGKKESDYSELRSSILWKIHGCSSDMSSIVFNSYDYYKIRNNKEALNEMYRLIRDKHCIMLGVSLQDEHITDIIFDLYEKNGGILQGVMVAPGQYLNIDTYNYMNKFISLAVVESEISGFLDEINQRL